MTKKKRELIEIILDNVKPEDWPDCAVYAAQDKETLAWGKRVLMFYSDREVPCVNTGVKYFYGKKVGREIKLPELCKHWDKTIVHRDEFMERWNEYILLAIPALAIAAGIAIAAKTNGSKKPLHQR